MNDLKLETLIGEVAAGMGQCVQLTNGKVIRDVKGVNKPKTELGIKVVSIIERLIEENRIKRNEKNASTISTRGV